MSAIDGLAREFARLPGVGPRTAARLVHHLLRTPPEEARRLADSILALIEKVRVCEVYGNFAEAARCDVCLDPAEKLLVLFEAAARRFGLHQEHQCASIVGHEAIALVRDAGGVAAWAHPPYDATKAELSELKALGMGAVEVEYPRSPVGRRRELRGWARDLGLAVTGGSDCHGPDEPANTLGASSITWDELATLRICRVGRTK